MSGLCEQETVKSNKFTNALIFTYDDLAFRWSFNKKCGGVRGARLCRAVGLKQERAPGQSVSDSLPELVRYPWDLKLKSITENIA